MTARTPARRHPFATPDLDERIAEAESTAIIIWRGEQLPFSAVPERLSRMDDRGSRDRLYGSYIEALEALNPLYEERLAAWKAAGDVRAIAGSEGSDPASLAVELERFSLHAETPYYAALRRYLALIGIEQGDATEADLWHVVRGSAWANWFGEREVGAAVATAGRSGGDVADLDGWRAAERRLAGEPNGTNPVVAAAVSRAYATLIGSPEWLVDELRVNPDDAIAFVDFATFVRLWRVRRLIAELQYELRLFATDDRDLQRAYHAGIVGHMTGVSVSEAEYLAGVDAPFSSARKIESTILAAILVETLEQAYGLRWWRDTRAGDVVGRVAGASGRDDALAELGYDVLDWRPVLRQIRTRLIGEMSGYGGPNITTRAGTRKV